MSILKNTIRKELILGDNLESFVNLKDRIKNENGGAKIQVDSENKLLNIQKKVREWVSTIEDSRYIDISYEFVEIRYKGTPWLIPLSELQIEFVSPFKESNTENERKRIVRNVYNFLKYNQYSLNKIAGFMNLTKNEVEQQLTHTNENIVDFSADIALSIGFDERKFLFPSFQEAEAASLVNDLVKRNASKEAVLEIEKHQNILSQLDEYTKSRRSVEVLKQQLIEASKAAEVEKEKLTQLVAKNIM
ncbi:hypothetical protein CN918_31330 [Priestia megaterium]|nr:hypothetical protein CN918_31330 [Priestia megaterium]